MVTYHILADWLIKILNEAEVKVESLGTRFGYCIIHSTSSMGKFSFVLIQILMFLLLKNR